MPHPPTTQFIVADGARARWIVRKDGAFVTTHEQRIGPKARRHPQGVVFDRAGGQRFDIEAHSDTARREKVRFAEAIAAEINIRSDGGAFQRLVIVAPSPMLNAIADRLSTPARTKFVGSLAKDLTKTADHELGAWLRPLELK